MTDLAYPECIRELYESEIFGEAAALALLDNAKSRRDAYHLGTLLQLETETKARLRPLLAGYGINLTEKMDLGDVNDMLAGYQASSWQEFTAAITPEVEGYLARFEAIAEVGPAQDKEVLQSMIHHESAILKWLRMESAGDTQNSLADMIAQLQYPLPETRAT